MSSGRENDWVADLSSLLATEEGIYGEILELSRKQSELVRGRDAESLMRVIGEKQDRIAKLGDLAVEGRALKERWKAEKESVQAGSRAEIEARLKTVAGLLESILAEENAAGAVLGRERAEAVERIKKLAYGRKVNKAYGGPGAPDARFTDSKR